MPIRKNILRKGSSPKQNLLGFDVLQQETGALGDLSTSKFFKISEFPSVLPTGNSSFLIEGSDFLKPNVELKTEILDSQGNPIFHYGIPNYDNELPARRIAVEVYGDDVVNGIGSFTILGELDPRKVDIPTAFQDTYNVRFSAPISINKAIKNTRPIRFYGDPTITVSELVKGVIQPVYTGNQKTATITGSVEVNTPEGGIPFLTPPGEKDGLIFGDSTQINEVGNTQISYISKTKGEAQSSILPPPIRPYRKFDNKPTYVVKAMEAGVDNADDKITGTMEGATLTINSPHNLVNSNHFPDSKWTKPTTFSTKILKVVNSTTFRTTTSYKIRSKKRNIQLVVPLQPSGSQVSITHNVGSVVRTASQIFQRSFANVTVGNLQTFSGDTYKAKIYAKEDGSSGEFEKIYETLVESPNELIDQNSDTGFKSVGIFATQSIVDNFWISSSAQFVATRSLAAGTSADDTIIDGIILSGSTEPHANSFTFQTSQTYSLEKNEPYLVDFDVAFKPTNKVQSDGTTKKDAKLEVFLTGPITSDSSEEFPLGEVELNEYDFNKVNTFTVVKKKQISDFLTHNETNTPSGSLGFRVSSGEFILSDVRLRPFSETNFSPGFFKANVPMPKAIKRGQPYDFLVEFYDANNSLAEAVAIADDVTFAGPRQVIGDGNDGVLTGSVFLSNTEDTGIEFHGGSAYIRSIGYNGFNRALDSGGSGFIMYSGSVSKSLNTSESYQGVGIELMDNSGANPSSSRFLKFRTNAEGEQSEFEVRTDNFLFGVKGITNNYISGSNGNLEISSSNFALQEDGDVVIEGTITAAVGGTIGGFNITTGSLSAADGHFFISGSASGSVGNFDKSNLFISSSGFQVNSQGDLIARTATITGEVNASSGTTADAITKVGIITGSLIISSSQASSSLESMKFTTGSLIVSRDAVNTETGSLQATDTAIGVTTGSLLTASSSMATQVKISPTGVDVQNELGGTISRFSTSAKFFGSASLSNTYAEVSEDGLTIVSGSVTQSFFGDEVIIGDVDSGKSNIIINSGALKLRNNTTDIISIASDGTMTFGSDAATAISGSSSAVSASAASAHSASKELRTQVVLDSGGMSLKNAAANKTLADYGATTKIFDGENNNSYIEVGGKSIDIISGSVTGSSFGAATSSFFGTGSNDHDRLEIVGDGIQVYKNNIQQVSIGDDVVVGQQASGQSNVQITSGALNFRNNATTIFSIANDGAVSFDSSDIRTLISGSFVSSSDASFDTAATGISGSTAAAIDAATGVSASAAAATDAATGVSASAAAATDAATGVSASAAVTSDVADTRAQLVLNNTTANNQKIDLVNTTGGLLASFGRSAKFFGSASNAADSVEINPDGINIIANAETASIFNAGGTTIMGGTATASLNAGGLALISAGVTGSLFSSTGAEIYGASDKNERITISPAGVSAIANNVTGSFVSHTGVAIYGASDKKERLDVNADGLTLIANNITGSLVNAGGVAIYGASDKNERVDVNADGLTIVANNVSASTFTSTTASFFGSSDKHERAEFGAEGLSVYDTNKAVAKFGATTAIGALEEAGSQLQIDSTGKLSVLSGSTTIFEVGTIDISEPVILSDGRVGEGTATSIAVMNAPTMSVGLTDTSNVNVGSKFIQSISNLDSTNQSAFGFTESSSAEGNGNQPGNYKINHYSVHNGSAGTTSDSAPGFQFNYTHASNVADSTKLSRFTGGVFDLNVLVESFTGTSHKPADKEFAALMINVDDNTGASGEDGYSFIHAKGSTNNGSITDKFQVSSSGDVIAAGNITAFGTAFASVSDRSWKKDIETFSGSLDRILDLKPRKFKWKKDDKEDYGFIAQEVEEIIPHIVRNQGFSKAGKGTGGQQHKTIDYAKLTPYLVDTIQELTKRIEELEKKVK